MRLNNFIENNREYPSFEGWLYFLQNNRIDEVSDATFQSIEKLGKKVGFKIKKSNTIFDYIKIAGKEFETILRLASLYLMTDISDKSSRKELMADIKNEIKKTNKKELMAFIMQMDKNLLHLTGLPRHVLSSIFGIEIGTYNQWLDDISYIEKEIKQIKIVLSRMPGTEREIDIINKFDKSFHDLIKV